MRWFALFCLCLLPLFLTAPTHGQPAASTRVCPANPTPVTGGAGFGPGGIILTSFDRSALWVYNVSTGTRYPLPETTPCGRNCRLAPDAQTITYFNQLTNAFNQMRLDGTQRTLVVEYASDVEWWTADTYLIWTPGQQAYLRTAGTDERQPLNADGVIAVQPGGQYGVVVEYAPEADTFRRALIDLERRGMAASGIGDGRVELGIDRAYFNAVGWSPDGAYLAYVAPTIDADDAVTGAELFGIAPGDAAPTQWTTLTDQYGAVRINGLAVGELSWSPDSTRIAYWVTPLADPIARDAAPPLADEAALHIYDVRTGEDRVYCAFTTVEHLPNPPRLIWSPDGAYVAFAGNIPADERGYLLLALDVDSGQLAILSEGIYPALGAPDLVAWGLPPP